MALDIYRIDTNEHVYALNDEQFDCLEPLFEQFYYSTGLRISRYDDLILNIDNCKLLIKLIDKYVETTDLNIDKKKTSLIIEFKVLLKLLIKRNIAIQLIGD